MSLQSNSLLEPGANACSLSTVSKPSFSPKLNVIAPLSRRNDNRTARCSVAYKPTVLDKKFFGTKLRALGTERLHLWQSDGPGKSPKLRVVVRSALSGVPEKPLGLYDPSFDKDSCGVGFVAQLSGESSRKTVSILQRHAKKICIMS